MCASPAIYSTLALSEHLTKLTELVQQLKGHVVNYIHVAVAIRNASLT